MKQTEREILSSINEVLGTGLKESSYQYARFDAHGDNVIAEIKYRDKHYDDTLIEFDKYSFNKEYAALNKMYFYYVVGVGDEVFCFDILELVVNNHNFLWEWKKMPITTEFGNKEFIYKYVGYIPLHKAFIRYTR